VTARCVQGEYETPDEIKVEIFSDKDYFMLYKHVCTHDQFAFVKNKNGLKKSTPFKDYLMMLVRLFNLCITEPDTYKFTF
jgi:hypothetical protein